jgi:hypothetical protein
MTTEKRKASLFRVILGSLLIAILALVHSNFLLQGNGLGITFLIVLIATFYFSKKQKNKEDVKHLQYQTASILSFLLPVSAMIYTFVFAGKAIQGAESEAEEAGAAIGSFLGGGVLIFFLFLIGLSLGIVFYILSRKK